MMNWNWPDNKRIALLLSFDIDAETLWLTRNDINERHLVHMSRGLYATKQGLPRILKMLEEEGLKATFFTTAYTAEIHPEIIQYIAAQGHEIGYHGYLHEVKDTYEEENALMDKVDAIFRSLTGKRPVGVRMPDGILHDFHKQLWLDRGCIYSWSCRRTVLLMIPPMTCTLCSIRSIITCAAGAKWCRFGRMSLTVWQMKDASLISLCIRSLSDVRDMFAHCVHLFIMQKKMEPGLLLTKPVLNMF